MVRRGRELSDCTRRRGRRRKAGKGGRKAVQAGTYSKGKAEMLTGRELMTKGLRATVFTQVALARAFCSRPGPVRIAPVLVAGRSCTEVEGVSQGVRKRTFRNIMSGKDFEAKKFVSAPAPPAETKGNESHTP